MDSKRNYSSEHADSPARLLPQEGKKEGKTEETKEAEESNSVLDVEWKCNAICRVVFESRLSFLECQW